MKASFLLALAGLLIFGMPSARLHSQALTPAAPADPFAALQTLSKSNEDLLKRQDQTLKDLTDMTATAHEARIFSKRG